MAVLVQESGEDAGRRVALDAGEVVLGRAPGDGVRVRDPKVSRRHVRVAAAAGGFEAEDLGSQNGTLLNGARLTRAALAHGDVLTLGHTSFRFEAAVAAPASTATIDLPAPPGPVTAAPPTDLALRCPVCEVAFPAGVGVLARCLCGTATPRVLLEQEARWSAHFALGPADLPAFTVPRPPAGGRAHGQRVGDYRVEGMIGRGGMGEVYLARRGDEAPVALKLLPKRFEMDGPVGRRFAREARLAREVHHPNLVPVLDAGVADEQVYLVMPYVEGVSLQDLVERHGPLAPETAGRIIGQAAKGLHAAHLNCIVHRDLKPGNILVTPAGRVRVADFGLATRTLASTQLTHSGQVVGTPAYMSPEQCDGRPADARSDVYALGATCYFLLTGRPPFEADNSLAVLLKHLQEIPAPPSAHRPGLPGVFDDLVLAMLEKDAGRRYQSCEALIWDLVQVLGGQRPTLLRGPTRVAELSRSLDDPAVSDSAVDAALRERQALVERGGYVPPLGELMTRAAAGATAPRATESPVGCVHCGTACCLSPTLGCASCGGSRFTGDLEISEIRGVAVLRSPAVRLDDVGPGHGASILALARACLAAGRRHIVLHYPVLERATKGNLVWVMEAFQAVIDAGGSLGICAPSDRIHAGLRGVGMDQYVRLFHTVEEVPAAG